MSRPAPQLVVDCVRFESHNEERLLYGFHFDRANPGAARTWQQRKKINRRH